MTQISTNAPPLTELNGLAKPPPGAVTKRQTREYWYPGGVRTTLLTGDPCPGGSYATYREMASNPTVVLAFAAATAPVKGAPIAVEADDDVPDAVVQYVQDAIWPIRPELFRDMLGAVKFGWFGGEIVWELRDGRATVERVKPLLSDITEVLVNEAGDVTGLRNKGVDLGPGKAFHFALDGEAGYPYGRSRFENFRETAWWPWRNCLKQLSSYGIKGASIIPVLTFPLGQDTDETGALRDNKDNAQRMLADASRGDAICLPMTFPPWAMELLSRGMSPEAIAKLVAWQLTFLETRSGHGAEYIQQLKLHESNIARGMLVPERAILEGQYGTKAESTAHIDVGLAIAQELLDAVVRAVNRGLVDVLVSVNYGPSMVGKVYIVAGRLSDADKQFIRGVWGDILRNPANMDLVQMWSDVDSALDSFSWPKAAEVVGGEPRGALEGADAEAVAAVTAEVKPPPEPEQRKASSSPIKSAFLGALARRRKARRYAATA